MTRVAFFVSGNGSNMENLVKYLQKGGIDGVQASLVLSDNPNAPALEKAKKLGVDTAIVDRKSFKKRAEFEEEIIRKLEMRGIHFICLAGFMRILSPEFTKKYRAKILNIHPSLLPHFPGATAIQDTFEAHMKETGVTVHFVDDGVDTGPIVFQQSISISPNDTLASLEAKIHEVEYQIYPIALRLVLSGAARYDE